MYKTLRIIFTIISAVFAGLALPVGYFLDGAYALPCAIGCAIVAFLAFGIMMVCKKNQEMEERRNPPQQSQENEKKE